MYIELGFVILYQFRWVLKFNYRIVLPYFKKDSVVLQVLSMTFIIQGDTFQHIFDGSFQVMQLNVLEAQGIVILRTKKAKTGIYKPSTSEEELRIFCVQLDQHSNMLLFLIGFFNANQFASLLIREAITLPIQATSTT